MTAGASPYTLPGKMNAAIMDGASTSGRPDGPHQGVAPGLFTSSEA